MQSSPPRPASRGLSSFTSGQLCGVIELLGPAGEASQSRLVYTPFLLFKSIFFVNHFLLT